MKEGIHPTYRDVCFVDLSNGFKFVTRSCVNSKETIKMDDGRELPLFKLETTAESHRKRAWTAWVVALRNSATNLPASKLPSNLLRLAHQAARTQVPAAFLLST